MKQHRPLQHVDVAGMLKEFGFDGEVSSTCHALDEPVVPRTQSGAHQSRTTQCQNFCRTQAETPFMLDKAKLLKKLKCGVQQQSGMTADHLKDVLENQRDSNCSTTSVSVGEGCKKNNGGIRGIVAGDLLRRLVARTMAQQLGPAMERPTAPFQHALTTRAGTECSAHAVQALMDATHQQQCCLLMAFGRSIWCPTNPCWRVCVEWKAGIQHFLSCRSSMGEDDGQVHILTQTENGASSVLTGPAPCFWKEFNVVSGITSGCWPVCHADSTIFTIARIFPTFSTLGPHWQDNACGTRVAWCPQWHNSADRSNAAPWIVCARIVAVVCPKCPGSPVHGCFFSIEILLPEANHYLRVVHPELCSTFAAPTMRLCVVSCTTFYWRSGSSKVPICCAEQLVGQIGLNTICRWHCLDYVPLLTMRGFVPPTWEDLAMRSESIVSHSMC